VTSASFTSPQRWCAHARHELIDVPPADWEFVIGVNIWGIIHGIRHFVPAILRHGQEGHIVNTASVAGFQNRRGTNQGPYSVSKYAALSLSEALEYELEGTNIGVSVLCPARSTRTSPAAPAIGQSIWGPSDPGQ
jgi:NAD(P)-dependent dehydrogenase (short-subunit alcohol dehydrogenase family)